MRALAVLTGLSVAFAPARPAGAQALGTFAWQVEPYCNIVTFGVTPDGPAYRLTGFDDQCGAGKMPAAGVVTPNPDGTFTLAFYLIAPDGQTGHTTATLSPGSYSGPWQDDAGLTGTARFNPGASSGGATRPVAEFQRRVWGTCPGSEFVQQVREDGSVECAAAAGTGGGDITSVAAGTGLTGGGATGDVTLGIAPGGVGSAQIADGSIALADIDVNQVQRRVQGICTPGTYFESIGANGMPTCSDGASGNSVALGWTALSVNTGLANTGIGQAALAANASGQHNTGVGANALQGNTTGSFNSALGSDALRSNAIGLYNVAVGWNALGANTSGSGNTSIGYYAMGANSTGDNNTALGSSVLGFNTVGSFNIGVGRLALRSNTSGSYNIGIGREALGANTTGSGNTAVGDAALYANTASNNTAVGSVALIANITGSSNVAVGADALSRNQTGSFTTAVGAGALTNSTGSFNAALGYQAGDSLSTGFENTAIGTGALRHATTGARNIAIGSYAGGFVTTGSDNIHIGFQGAANESDTIRIGLAQTRAFIRGIRGVTTGAANAVAVLVDSNGQLGTISSSRRTKEDIHDMGEASAAIFRLRPVMFRYVQSYADGSKPRDYGLIAEEVEDVYPDLVVRNEAGEVETVQYHKLVPMLLNELQRLRRDLDRAIHPGRGCLGTTEPNADGVP